MGTAQRPNPRRCQMGQKTHMKDIRRRRQRRRKRLKARRKEQMAARKTRPR